MLLVRSIDDVAGAWERAAEAGMRRFLLGTRAQTFTLEAAPASRRAALVSPPMRGLTSTAAGQMPMLARLSLPSTCCW